MFLGGLCLGAFPLWTIHAEEVFVHGVTPNTVSYINKFVGIQPDLTDIEGKTITFSPSLSLGHNTKTFQQEKTTMLSQLVSPSVSLKSTDASLGIVSSVGGLTSSDISYRIDIELDFEDFFLESNSNTSITLITNEGGTAKYSPGYLKAGSTITITATPDEGYTLDSISITDSNKVALPFTTYSSGSYGYTQPEGAVKVTVFFKKAAEVNSYALFNDVKVDDWCYSSVQFAIEEGIMSGMGDGYFGPEEKTQRAMIVTMLHSLAGKPAPSVVSSFADVSSSSYYANAVAWAKEENVISDSVGSYYEPEFTISREEICLLLYNYANTQTNLPMTTVGTLDFNDNSSISDWAKEAVKWCYEKAIVSGKDGGNFAAKDFATRAEVATMFRKFMALDLSKKEENTTVKLLTEEEAREIAYQYWNYTPGLVDSDTGYELSVASAGLNDSDSGENQYYLFYYRWKVDEFHFSTIDILYVDAFTGECFDMEPT